VIEFEGLVEAADEEVEATVLIIVDPGGGGGVAKGKEAEGDGLVGEDPLAVVAEKRIGKPMAARHVEIEVTVAVEVAGMESVARLLVGESIEGDEHPAAADLVKGGASGGDDLGAVLTIEVAEGEGPFELGFAGEEARGIGVVLRRGAGLQPDRLGDVSGFHPRARRGRD
jgi:hypothetical protein